MSIGDWYNVTCREGSAVGSLGNYQAILEENPEGRLFAESNLILPGHAIFTPAICSAWGDGTVAESEYEPVVSDIATLIGVGYHDPSSNEAEAARIGATLENSFGPYEFPGMGHVVYGGHACPTAMFNAFIIDPLTEPNSSCMDEMQLAFDIPGQGRSEIALEPLNEGELGFSTLIPTGWEELAPGVYARGNPSLDPTMLIQLAVPNEAAPDAIAGVLANLGAPDLPDVAFMTLDSEDLNWSVYIMPGAVIRAVATASNEGTTFVVAVQADESEFDAMADGLLVPVIMAVAPRE